MALLYHSLGLLHEKLASSELQKFARKLKVRREFKKWGKTLSYVRERLDDAEVKWLSKETAVEDWHGTAISSLDDAEVEQQSDADPVKPWLRRLRELVYEMGVFLNEISVQPPKSKFKVFGFIPCCCITVDPSFKLNKRSKAKGITEKLKVISEQGGELGLQKIVETVFTWKDLSTRSFDNGILTRSRGKDRENFVKSLLREDGQHENIVSVFPIVGRAGVGKTALAQLVYEDEEIPKKFDLKAWVSVADVFDAVKITREILFKVTSQSYDLKSFSEVQVALGKALKGKRFLLVLDDVRDETYDEWHGFLSPFMAQPKGTKILVTTCDKELAMFLMGANRNLCHLEPLLYDDCWSAFAEHAFRDRDIGDCPDLVLISKKIVEKCRGLPLVARMVGSLLISKQSEHEWEEVWSGDIWNSSGHKMFSAMFKLSYNYLPLHLKSCLAYCAIFPRGYEFEQKELVLLWMAEGFIQQADNSRPLEDIGNEYFSELLWRLFFQPSHSNKSRFLVHNWVYGLVQLVAKEICFPLKHEGNDRPFTITKNACHASFPRHRYMVPKKFETIKEAKFLRTFLPLPTQAQHADCYLTAEVSPGLVSKLKDLRVLSLSGFRITELPNSIGRLKNLRYLDFSWTSIKWLPSSANDLFNLQTLILCGCKNLTRLPIGIWNLTNLQHLDIRSTPKLEKMPPRMGNLRNLRTLSKFIVGSSGIMSRISELQNLNDLSMELSILQLQNVVRVQDAADANLGGKKKIKVLRMEWSSNFEDSRDAPEEMDVIECLKPHADLERLTIEFYGGPRFPLWIEDPSFSAMTHLNLTNCSNCESVPSLGKLPKLQVLYITGMDKVTKVDAEFYGVINHPEKPFQSLESLTFENMPAWEIWHPVGVEGVFPCLRELKIRNCPKLTKELPSQLPSLVQLDIIGCPDLEVPFQEAQSRGEINEEGNLVAMQRSGVDHSSLVTLKVQKVSKLTCLHEEFVQFWSALQVLEVHDCIHLTSLWQQGSGLENLRRLVIKGCPQLVSLARNEEQGLPSNLEYLEITSCDNMETLPNGLQCLTRLEDLKINGCPKLESFSEVGFPPMLTGLTICNCELLNSLPSINSKMRSLECLKIKDCPSLTCFPEGELPTSLKELDIQDCDKLRSLPEGMMHSNAISANDSCCLEVLKILRCSSLTSFPGGKLSATLKQLEIRNCQQLEVISEQMLHLSSSLECVEVCDCPNLKTLAGCLSPNLKNLHVGNCKNLKLLSGQMQNLSCLRSLCIQRCPGLESFQIGVSNTCLTILKIEDCENLKTPLSDWGLHRLTSLQQLSIAGIFPGSHTLDPLPETLTYISIGNFKNLKSVESLNLQHRTSLQELRITDCMKLESLLPSTEKLPPTLARLLLRNCPLLCRMYLNRKKDWAQNIAHVPCIQTYD